ncbi:MAG: hypothetical protein QJR12_16870 [Mycobacterium sp.]|uniref:hypothetical protein n=1 Tax=Mycobacterium sp. TaxID=1785 RepID=UPI0026216F9C|nr:hypothetical protein [Mycobacterium sp.]MDI3315880.1 hypothetical protein [Mycobacterium sp.]
MRTVTLPSGHTATLREAGDLKNKHRKQVLKEMGLEVDPATRRATVNGGEFLDRMNSALLRVAITDWTVTGDDGQVLQIPSLDPTSLDEISALDGAALEREIGPLREVVLPDFGPSPDEASPTPPSGA